MFVICDYFSNLNSSHSDILPEKLSTNQYKCYCLSSRVFLESLILLFCRPNNQKSLTQKDGENDFLLQFIQYKASLSLDFLHEKFLDQEVLMELAVIEWAAKWKLFNPFFFFLDQRRSLIYFVPL